MTEHKPSKADREAVLARLRERLASLDTTLDLEAFLAAAGRVLLEETGAAACGLARRFPGAALDLAILVPREGEPLRKSVPLRRADRYTRLPLPESMEGLPGFQHAMLRDLAAGAGIVPRQVHFFVMDHGGRPVADLELSDPDPARFPSRAEMEAVLAGAAVHFKVVVIQERLRRERLEAQLLHAVGRELGRTLDLDDLLTTILDLLRQVVPFDAAAVYVLDEGGLSAVHQSMRGYDEDQKRLVEIELDEGLVGWAARTGEAVVVSDVTRDVRYLKGRPSTRSEMVVPLKSGGRVIGVFNMESDRPDAYSPHDLELLSTFAGQAGAAVDRARLLEEGEAAKRLEQEMALARRIQQEFLPDPEVPVRGGAISGITLSSTEVGGDYFDFLERSDGSLGVAVADVSGKGIPAALIMASLRAAFRLSATRLDDPGILCRVLNEFLFASLGEIEFVTGVFGFLDKDHRTFRYANAGHNHPLLVHADGSYRWLATGGMILGAFPDQAYESEGIALGPGDRLVFYTDGVTEAHPGNHDEFGNDRLLGVIRSRIGQRPRAIQDAILRAVEDYSKGEVPDDLTVVVIAGGPREDA